MRPYLRVANVFDGRIDYSDVLQMHFSQAEQQRYNLRRGDILLNEGQSLELVGRCALYDGPDDAYCFQNTLVRFRPGPALDPRFALASFKRWFDVGRFTTIAKQTTSIAHLGADRFARLRFPQPPMPEQRCIADVLSTIDEAIEQTEALIAKNEQIKAGLMHDLFTRGVTPDGQLRPPHEEAPKLYKQSPLGWIPKEWESERLAAKATVRGGKRLPVGHRFSEETTTFRYLHTTDFIGRPVTYEQLTYISRETFEALRSYEIVDGDIYISIAGVNLGWAGVFRPTITDRTILTENAAKILLGGGDSPEFVARQIDSESAQRQILVEAGIGAGVPKLALFRIKNLWLAWPNRNEQDQISSRCLSLDLILDTHQELRRKLAGQKAGLMHDLLTGRVRVPVPAQGSRA